MTLQTFIMRGYHPILFGLIVVFGLVELGLTAWFESNFNATGWPSAQYQNLINFLLFDAVWTVLFGLAYVFWIAGGAMHILASIAGSTIWLLITAIFWVVGAALFDQTRGGANCLGAPSLSICREAQAIEVIAWIEFALCILTILAAVFWTRSSRRNYNQSYYA